MIERAFNVEFSDPTHGWSAQHTAVESAAEARDLARALWCAFQNDGRRWPVRLTQGHPFGTVVADFNRRGAFRWLDYNLAVREALDRAAKGAS